MDHQTAVAARRSWQSARAAASRLAQAADVTARAYQFGEHQLEDLLTNRRQANEAALGARLSQLGAPGGELSPAARCPLSVGLRPGSQMLKPSSSEMNNEQNELEEPGQKTSLPYPWGKVFLWFVGLVVVGIIVVEPPPGITSDFGTLYKVFVGGLTGVFWGLIYAIYKYFRR